MRLTFAALLLTALAACGGDPGLDVGMTTAPELAAELDCVGSDAGTRHKVSCEFGDSFLGITTYNTRKAYESDVKVAQSAGASILVNDVDLWMIDAPDAATLESAQEIVGGKIK